MKCSRFLSLFLFLLISPIAIGSGGELPSGKELLVKENIVFPKNNTELSNGDITNLIIESELSDEEIKKFEHTKITDVIYVLKFIRTDHGREFEVVFSDPSKRKRSKKYPFIMRGVNYKFDKEKTAKSFSLFKTNYKPKKTSDYFFLIVSGLLGLVLLIIFYRFLQSYILLQRYERKVKKNGLQIIDLFHNAKSREEIEDLYRKKEKLLTFTNVNLDKWQEFEKVLNKVQFKRDWHPEDSDIVLKAKKSIGKLELKNGI